MTSSDNVTLPRPEARYLSNNRDHYTILYFTYVTKSPDSESDGGHVEGVGDEVHDVPEVAGVLLQPHVPQLLDLAPDEAGHPGEDAELNWGGQGASLGEKQLSVFSLLFPCSEICLFRFRYCLLSGLEIIHVRIAIASLVAVDVWLALVVSVSRSHPMMSSIR